MTEIEEFDGLLFELFDVSVELQREIERMAAVVGQTRARMMVLGTLAEEEEDLTSAGLARRLGLTPQSVHRVVVDLMDEGLIVGLPNPRHARSPLLRVTDAGRAVRAPFVAAASDWSARIAEGIDQADVRAARRVLRALLEAHENGLDQ